MEVSDVIRLIIHFPSPRMGHKGDYFSVNLVFERDKVIYKKIRLGGPTEQYPDVLVERELDEAGKEDYALLIDLAVKSPAKPRRPRVYDMSPRYAEVFDTKGEVKINTVDSTLFWDLARRYREALMK